MRSSGDEIPTELARTSGSRVGAVPLARWPVTGEGGGGGERW